MGHVPSGPFSRARPGAHVPRRQRRRAGAVGDLTLTAARRSLGRAGEQLAAWYLSNQGLELVARNVEVEGGEVDLLMMDGAERVAVEVRSTTTDTDPVDRAPPAKRRRVARLARSLGAARLDIVGVGFDRSGAVIHWIPGAS